MRSMFKLFILAGLFTVPAMAQPDAPTGSRIDGKPISTHVVWFNEPHEVDTVRRLLQEGRVEEAVEMARRFVQRLEHLTDQKSQQYLYYGLNALCASLMKSGELAQAMDTCDQAIALYPDNWRAYNNRGTVNFFRGELQAALADYRQALAMGEEMEPAIDLIRHNIDLVESRMATAE